jgi:hypothetical protein
MADQTQQPNVSPKTSIENEPSLQDHIARGMASLALIKEAGYKKPESPAVLTRKLAQFAGIYPLPDLAVDLCIAKWEEAIQQQRDAGVSLVEAAQPARAVYCAYLPKLSTRDEVSEFIACVAYGMANGIIPGSEGTRLLYAAQVAHSTLPSPKRRKKRNKTSQKQPSTPGTTPDPATT